MSAKDDLDRFEARLRDLNKGDSAASVLPRFHDAVVNIAGVAHEEFDATVYEAFHALLGRARRKLRLAARAEAEATLAQLKEEA